MGSSASDPEELIVHGDGGVGWGGGWEGVEGKSRKCAFFFSFSGRLVLYGFVCASSCELQLDKKKKKKKLK